jgi:adenylate cyclase
MRKKTAKSGRKWSWLRHNWLRVSLSLFIVGLFLLDTTGSAPLPLMDRFENITYDARMRATSQTKVDERIVIIDLDERSLTLEGHWPWSRAKMARLVDKLFNEYGILLLAMDVVFAERDETESLSRLDKVIDSHDDAAIRNALKTIRDDLDNDNVFSESIRDLPVVLGYYFTHDPRRKITKGRLPAPVITSEALKGIDVGFVEAEGYGANISILEEAAMSSGYFENPLQDDDGVIRRAPMLQMYKGALYESLSMAAARIYLGGIPELDVVGTEDSDYKAIENITLARQNIPVDHNAAALVPYRGQRGSFRYISATDILNDAVDNPDALIGAAAFLGTTAPGLVDLRATPVSSVFPGVEIHANLLAGILDNTFKHRPAWTIGAELLFILLVGLMLSFMLPDLDAIWATLMTVAMLGLTIMANLHYWTEQNIVFHLAPSVLLITALFLFNMSYGFLTESRSRNMLGSLFGQYVPEELVNDMASDPSHFSMKGDSRDMTVMFSDIRSFTNMSEGLKPEELSKLLNIYLTPMTAIVHETRGTIDKYIGDAMMAFWGAPVKNPKHANDALTAALEMMEKLKYINRQFKVRGWPEVKIGIGINSGVMNVGNMGSEFRMAYTVLGDEVNLASRLEGLTKQYNTPIIVGEKTRDRIANYYFRELDRVRVKGKDKPVKIFEPYCSGDEIDPFRLEVLEQYYAALQHYRKQQWGAATRLFYRLQQRDSGCLLYGMYMKRIELYQQEPPGDDWDGVFTHTTK